MLPALALSHVGEITLVVGQFEVQRSAVSSQLAKGDAILEGDVIKTMANGHVHIRFIDGALVSVRPNSVFTIHEFRFNPDQPQDSAVRFTLERGQVRAISGQATQEAKDRFRLNTPLVAIGIKGTDFITQSDQGFTRVTVNQGAIVMAPFDQACSAEALGVCGGDRAKDLTAEMIGMSLVYRIGSDGPSLQLISEQKESSQLSQLGVQARQNLESNTPATVTPDNLLPPSRLVWGRWSQTPAPGDNMTISFRQALQGNEVTVGDGYYFLFREPNIPNQLPHLGSQASFKLQDASAQYRTPSNELIAAQVSRGTLQVDFAQRSFTTQLQVEAPGISPQNLNFSGSVDVHTGIFLSPAATGQGSLAGALGLDGRQAGYLFNSPLGNGGVSGATLWGR